MAAPSILVDNVAIYATTTGNGAIGLGAAVQGYRGQEALINGGTYSYSIRQQDQYEYGRATYLSTSQSFVRAPLASSNGGGPINLSPNAIVAIVVLAEDITVKTVIAPLTGFGAPTIGLGGIGDFYYNLTQPVTLYGPKTSAGWGAGVVLQGAAATVTIGSVTTGQPGQPGSVTNTGTATAAILNFVLPVIGVTSLALSPTVLLGTSDQSSSLEFPVKAWGQQMLNTVTFEISVTARDRTSPNGALTINALPFTADGISAWPLSLDEVTGLPTGTKAVMVGDTIVFKTDDGPVDWTQMGDTWSFRVSGSVPVLA